MKHDNRTVISAVDCIPVDDVVAPQLQLQPILDATQVHASGVASLSFHPETATLLTASKDGTMRSFEVAFLGLNGITHAITSLLLAISSPFDINMRRRLFLYVLVLVLVLAMLVLC